ncbi:MAG: putative sensor domain DACNV-containing protein [Pyrinomonadaceae bacterium]
MVTRHPTYQAARAVASAIETHFATHLAAAKREGEDDLASAPDAQTIETIIDVTFWASLLREEGNSPKISLAFLSPDQTSQPLLFEHPLLLARSVLTKLAPAVERPGVHLGVWPHGEELLVWGATRSVPSFCFVLEVIEPGLLVVKHRRLDGLGKFANVAVLKGDQVKVIDEQGTSLPDCPDLLKSLLAFTSSVETGNSVNVLIQLAVSMRAHGHGGTLLVVPAGTASWRESIVHPAFYSVNPSYAALTALIHEDFTESEASSWEAEVRRAVDTVAGLTAVDGATVISDNYELLAFGAKIRPSEGSTSVERIVATEPIVSDKAIVVHPAQNGGTRHLSAAQFVFDQRDTLALVASQDGRFTIFAWSPCEDMVHAHRVDALLM